MIGLLAAVALAQSPSQDEALYQAVKANNLRGITRALDRGADPNAVHQTVRRRFLMRPRVTTTLATQVAAQRALKGDLRALTLLLEAGARPEPLTSRGMPAVAFSLKNGTASHVAATLELLLLHGADPQARFEDASVLDGVGDGVALAALPVLVNAGASSDTFLCETASATVSGTLLELGADPNAWCAGARPLLLAVGAQDAERATVLLDGGADVDGVGLLDRAPATALHVAGTIGWRPGVELLVSRGAQVNRAAGRLGNPPLSMAAGEGRVALIEAGAWRLSPQTPPEEWAIRPPDPMESGAVVASWLKRPDTPLPDEWELAFEGLNRATANYHVQLAKPASFVDVAAGLTPQELALGLGVGRVYCPLDDLSGRLRPKLSHLRAGLGRPTTKQRVGAVRTWTWKDVMARSANGTVFEVTGACPGPVRDMVGQRRQVARIALGPPLVEGVNWDRWDFVVAYYENGRITRIGRRF